MLSHVMHVVSQVYANVKAPGGSWDRCFGANAANPNAEGPIFIKATHSFKILIEAPNQCRAHSPKSFMEVPLGLSTIRNAFNSTYTFVQLLDIFTNLNALLLLVENL